MRIQPRIMKVALFGLVAMASLFPLIAPSIGADQAETDSESSSDGSWVLAYATDFSGDSLGKQWEVSAGQASVVNGELVLSSEKQHAEIILLEPRFLSSGVRMEFEAYVAEKSPLSDLTAFINARKTKDACASAYLFQFGAEQNTVNRVRRLGQIVESTESTQPLLDYHQVYYIVVENDRGQISFEIDGQRVLTWTDAQPLWGPDQCHIGLYTWESEIRIKHLKIYHLVPEP